jgi:hypothetical protein
MRLRSLVPPRIIVEVVAEEVPGELPRMLLTVAESIEKTMKDSTPLPLSDRGLLHVVLHPEGLISKKVNTFSPRVKPF